MRRKRTMLRRLAAIGWVGTFLTHVMALLTGEAADKRRWKDRRNRFLLLASLTTNTLVFVAVYRYGTALIERLQRQ